MSTTRARACRARSSTQASYSREMCCFSGPVHVEGTQIFARTDKKGWQGIVYEMKYTSSSPVAMVLPLPVSREPSPLNGGVPVRFVDLSEYPAFFKSLDNGFPRTLALSKGGDDDDVPAAAAAQGKLRVERVGNFVASFVPTVRDFARLDERFRMSDDVWRKLPQYRDWGFAVFQLAAERAGHVHPMSFLFRTRDRARVFFPTVHVHDGSVPRTARFDHMLYAQCAGEPEGWTSSPGHAREFVDIERAHRLVRAQSRVVRQGIYGEELNQDVWIDA
jgi:hypothetical protein